MQSCAIDSKEEIHCIFGQYRKDGNWHWSVCDCERVGGGSQATPLHAATINILYLLLPYNTPATTAFYLVLLKYCNIFKLIWAVLNFFTDNQNIPFAFSVWIRASQWKTERKGRRGPGGAEIKKPPRQLTNLSALRSSPPPPSNPPPPLQPPPAPPPAPNNLPPSQSPQPTYS